MYTIDLDHARGLLTLTLSGFWTIDEAEAFKREEHAAVRRLGRQPGRHLVLADATDFAVQSQDVSSIIRDLVLNETAPSTRIAVVGTTGLAALQSKRIASSDDTRFFERKEDAVAWLLSERE